MNTNAMSVVNLESLNFEGAVLLDEPERGAAGIWDVKCTDDKIVVSHSGTHEISVIDYPSFIRKFEQYPQKASLAQMFHCWRRQGGGSHLLFRYLKHCRFKYSGHSDYRYGKK